MKSCNNDLGNEGFSCRFSPALIHFKIFSAIRKRSVSRSEKSNTLMLAGSNRGICNSFKCFLLEVLKTVLLV